MDDVARYDCPVCGEEGYNNWIVVGTGNYDKDRKLENWI